MSENLKSDSSVPKSPSRNNGSSHLSDLHNFSTKEGAIIASPALVDEESRYLYHPTLGPAPSNRSPRPQNSSTTASEIRRPSEAPAETTDAIGLSRRGKGHTSNACNNCKRAHLGCDSKRPCGRCLATGKQDSCADVPQKKRGRPRLRGDSNVEAPLMRGHTFVGLDASNYMRSQTMQPPEMAHHRTDSMRSMLSMEGSSVSASTTSPTSTRDPIVPTEAWASIFARQPHSSTTTITPAAWLDLDLSFLKVNEAFTRLFPYYQQLHSPRLTDLATPLYSEALSGLRTSLRDEREAKDPSFLPPIQNAGVDLLGSIDDSNEAELSRGFDVRRVQLSFHLPNGGRQNLQTRFALAKSSRYFVIMSLPPLTPDILANVVDLGSRDDTLNRTNLDLGIDQRPMSTVFVDSRIADALSPEHSSSGESSPIRVANQETAEETRFAHDRFQSSLQRRLSDIQATQSERFASRNSSPFTSIYNRSMSQGRDIEVSRPSPRLTAYSPRTGHAFEMPARPVTDASINLWGPESGKINTGSAEESPRIRGTGEINVGPRRGSRDLGTREQDVTRGGSQKRKLSDSEPQQEPAQQRRRMDIESLLHR